MIDNKNCWLKDLCNHKDCDKFCQKHYKLNYLYNYAYVPKNQRIPKDLYLDDSESSDLLDVESFSKMNQITKDIVEVVDKGQSIYIHSTQCGNGKTSWAIRMLQSYFHHIWMSTELKCRGLFISVPRLLLELKQNISTKSEYIQDIKENIYSADIVIWDDIGTKLITPFEAENLFAMIDGRIYEGKTNIFTSNLTDEELNKDLGDRLMSRIKGSTFNFELHGGDKRGVKND